MLIRSKENEDGTEAQLTSYSLDEIQYAIQVERTLRELEAQLHNVDDPEIIAKNMLVAAATFYDGDWCGIFDVDLTMKVWTPVWWFNRITGGMTPTTFMELEEGDYLPRWITSIQQGKPMVIEDVAKIKDAYPREYEVYQRLHARSLIAVPFWKRPTGFLLVRNPKRYIHRTSLLQMMAFVAVSSVNEKRLMDRTKMSLTPDVIQKDTDVIMNFLGDFQIITSKGVLTEAEIKSPRMCRMLVYLQLQGKRAASPYEISNAIWPEEDPSNAGKNMKSLVYRFQQCFSLISDYRLVESTAYGYRLNPELNIMTDLQIFDRCWQEGQKSTSVSAKANLMKKALEIYKTGVLPAYASEHWLMPTVAHYSLRYIGIMNELLTTLDVAKDYVCIHEYANTALEAVPGSGDAFYWLIYAMVRLGTTEIARNELKLAEQALTQEDYEDLVKRLKNSCGELP